MAKEKANYHAEILKLVSEEEGERGGSQIRIVRWSKTDGTLSQPSLEKRIYRKQANGNKYFSTAKGFTRKDLNTLVDNWDDIVKVMESVQ